MRRNPVRSKPKFRAPEKVRCSPFIPTCDLSLWLLSRRSQSPANLSKNPQKSHPLTLHPRRPGSAVRAAAVVADAAPAFPKLQNQANPQKARRLDLKSLVLNWNRPGSRSQPGRKVCRGVDEPSLWRNSASLSPRPALPSRQKAQRQVHSAPGSAGSAEAAADVVDAVDASRRRALPSSRLLR